MNEAHEREATKNAIHFYNTKRLNESLDFKTPIVVSKLIA
jgi:hypothetical protein